MRCLHHTAVVWLNESDVTSNVVDKHSWWCLEARRLSSLWDQVLSPMTKWKTDTFIATEACPRSFLILIPFGSFLEDFHLFFVLKIYSFSFSPLPFIPPPFTKTEGNQHSNKFAERSK